RPAEDVQAAEADAVLADPPGGVRELLARRVLLEDRVADVVAGGLEGDARVDAAGRLQLLDVVLGRHVRHEDHVEGETDLLRVALAELVEPLVAEVEDVVDEVDELEVVAPL